MKTFNSSILAAAIGLALSTGALAMSKTEYQAARDRLEVDFKSDRAGCEMSAGNAKHICRVQAKGKQNVARAELEAAYKPGPKTSNDVRLAKAEADFAEAKEKCDDRKGNAKDVCVKEAKATHTAAKADAKASMKITDARTAARQETSDARVKASDKITDARTDAAADKRAAELKLANAKCDPLQGAARDSCIKDAQARFGKI